jgi:hypothetical protein
MTGFNRCLIRIRKLRAKRLPRRFMLSVRTRTARFMRCFLITRKNWRRRCGNAGIVVKKTGDPLPSETASPAGS